MKSEDTMVLREYWDWLTGTDNIYESVRPLVYISLFGLAPVPMNTAIGSVLGFCISLIHFFFFVICLIASLFEGDTIVGYFFQSTITKLSDTALMMSGIIVMLSIFLIATFRKPILIQILRKSVAVDEIFERLGLKFNHRKIMLFTLLISLIMVSFNAAYLVVSYFLLVSADIIPSIAVFATFALPHINCTLMVFKFMCATQLVKNRFLMLNEILQDMLDLEMGDANQAELSAFQSDPLNRKMSLRTRSNIGSSIRRNLGQSLKEITNIHNILCDVCSLIEGYFAYPFVAIIGTSFMFFLFDVYYILEGILNPDQLDSYEAHEFFTFFVIQMLWYVIIIVAVVEGSSDTIKESEKTPKLVMKLLNTTENLELRGGLMRLSTQLAHRKISFTAANLFKLDRTLLLSVTGTATCYLIILVQIRSMGSSKNLKIKFGNFSKKYN